MRCDDIERLLVNRLLGELTTDENLLVEEHLRICPQCRSYQIGLLNMQNAMQAEGEERLTPDPAIRRAIVGRMKALRSQKTGPLAKTWQHVRGVFAYRIPVYQALFSAALILLIFIGAKQLTFSTGGEVTQARLGEAVPSQMSVIDNLEILKQQKIGLSAKEDTTLARFIVSTM